MTNFHDPKKLVNVDWGEDWEYAYNHPADKLHELEEMRGCAHLYQIGRAKSSALTSEQLAEMGLVGVYRRKGIIRFSQQEINETQRLAKQAQRD